jgi:Raf kinase inhibitor-like YbhB/YbcL family protein
MPRQSSSPKQRYRQYRVSIGAVTLLMASLYTGNELFGQEATVTFQLTSPAFADGADIPLRYTCEGQDVSPPLTWSGAPAGTKSLALIVDDPDAPDPARPRMTWVHWVLYDLPASSTALAEAADAAKLPPGTKPGLNDWNKLGYGGPCPPTGKHRYFHKLYALDVLLPSLRRPTKAALEAAMKGHILGEAHLMGTYQKKR